VLSLCGQPTAPIVIRLGLRGPQITIIEVDEPRTMSFRLLDRIEIPDGAIIRRIALYEGSLTALPKEHSADILVVSAFPNDYTPTETSLIGSLYAHGLSVRLLAETKAHDLRATCAFWISNPIKGPAASLNIRQIACFEPDVLGSPPAVVGNLFRGLFPFLDDQRNQVVAMPLLASGDQGYSQELMFRSILDAAAHWLARGLAISELKIVERNPDRANALATVIADFKSTLSMSKLKPSEGATFDVFLSFSKQDGKAADCAKAELNKKGVVGKIFDFRLQIDNGKSWQEEIDRAISSCKAIIAILSPSYFNSPECREELMQARLRNKRSDRTLLFPIYWLSWQKELDLWLQVLNYGDCREGDYHKLTRMISEVAFE
jgi:TIR domain